MRSEKVPADRRHASNDLDAGDSARSFVPTFPPPEADPGSFSHPGRKTGKEIQ